MLHYNMHEIGCNMRTTFPLGKNVFIYKMVSIHPIVLKLGEDLCVSLVDMPVKSEEPESLAAIVTGAYVTSGNFGQKA